MAGSQKNYSTLLINYCDCGKDCEAKATFAENCSVQDERNIKR